MRGNTKSKLLLHRKFLLWLDSILLFLFLLTLSPRLTGLPLHEIIGIVFIVPVIIHLLVAWRWILNALKQFFKKSKQRLRFNFVLNALLFIAVIIQIVSGIVISQVALPFYGIHTINDASWRFLHNQTSTAMMLIVGFHLALNWNWIISFFRKRVVTKIQLKLSPAFLTTVSRVVIILFFSCIITLALYAALGKPNLSRLYTGNEIARFRPTVGHGALQFFGESFLVAVVVYIARRWLKVKL